MANDDYVSPYLLQPLRSYAQALRDRERHNTRVEPSGDFARDRLRAAVESEKATAADEGR